MKILFEHARVPGLIHAWSISLPTSAILICGGIETVFEHHADALLHRGVGTGQPAHIDTQDSGIARIDTDDAKQGLDGR